MRIRFCLPGIDGITDLGLPCEDPELEPVSGDQDGDLPYGQYEQVGLVCNEMTRIYRPF